MTTISVIMPAYNHARWIREAIDSIFAQTLPPLEVIVVDDGSTDDTPAVLASYGSRIRTLRQSNAGVGAARNAGIALARGHYLAFLDADDVWAPRKLELQQARFEADPTLGLVHCGAEMFDDDGHTLRLCLAGLEGWVSRDMLLLRREVITTPGSGMMVPRHIAEALGGFDPRMPPSEDWDFCYRVATRWPVGYVREVLVRYRQHGAGIHLDIPRMEKAMLLGFEKAFAADPTLEPLRRPSYGRLHTILAGCYLQSRKPWPFVRHALRSLRYDPMQFVKDAGRWVGGG